MKNYYVKRGDKIHGPYTWDKVRKGVESRKLREADLLSESTDGPWFPVVESVEYLGSEEATEDSLRDTDGDDLWGQDLGEAVEQAWLLGTHEPFEKVCVGVHSFRGGCYPHWPTPDGLFSDC